MRETHTPKRAKQAVERPGAHSRGAAKPPNEDDGVILSVVLDTRKAASFLLILDASTFSELARADAPHPIPYGSHGAFLAQASRSAS